MTVANSRALQDRLPQILHLTATALSEMGNKQQLLLLSTFARQCSSVGIVARDVAAQLQELASRSGWGSS